MKNYKRTLIVFLAGMIIPYLAFSQKAYDAIYYEGKVNKLTVQLMLANGYPAGSVLKVNKTNIKQPLTYLPETDFVGDDKQMKFYPSNSINKKDSTLFIVYGIAEVYNTIPKRLLVVYFDKRKKRTFFLNRRSSRLEK